MFSIEPISGRINPNSELIVTIMFKPEGPMQYSGQAYCNITCNEDRLPLQIVGLGLGPRAAFTNLANNKKELGDVYIDDKVHFYLDLENKGEIESR